MLLLRAAPGLQSLRGPEIPDLLGAERVRSEQFGRAHVCTPADIYTLSLHDALTISINDFVECYCSEPRLAFNRSVVLRYRIYLEQKGYAPNTINLRLAAVRRVAYEACDS